MAKTTGTPWHKVLTLRDDILSGTLSQREFAADLHDVIMDENRGVYHDPASFFALTYPTTRLRELAKEVAQRLARKSDKAVRQMALTYGGGKTHALVTLTHLFRQPDTLPDLPAVREFTAHIGFQPAAAHIAAVVFDRLDPELGSDYFSPQRQPRRFKYPWTAIAWQLGGDEGLALVQEGATERETSPTTNYFEKLLRHAGKDGKGILILLDEVLMWARIKVGENREWLPRLRDFFQHLTQAAGRVDGTYVLASLLASDPARNDELGRDIEAELSVVFQRAAEDRVQPVEKDDVAEVLRRRMFAPESYTDRSKWKQHVVAALNGICDLDEQTKRGRNEADARYERAYPFHPDLTEVLFEKWTQLDQFQRTRGVLRTFALALRDAQQWGDSSLLVGPASLLAAPDTHELSPAAKELAAIARLEVTGGKQQDWNAILLSELAKAREIQAESHAIKHREVEQAVIAAFMHAQPPGQRAQAQTRELLVLVGQSAPDRIELGKALGRWADVSWYLDDSFTGDREGGLPKVWRLGSKPNLRQMHHEARSNRVSDTMVEDVLLRTIEKAGALSEGAGGLGAVVHKLPTNPGEVGDDGQFRYVILGPSAASEAGKPAADAVRFITEKTGGAERAFPNAVVLAVPSRDGLAAAREKIRDFLGWKEVQDLLKTQVLDYPREANLQHSLHASENEMKSTALLAYTVVVTLGADGKVAAFRLSPDREPLFGRIVAERNSRIHTQAINAATLLPGGPFGLWQAGETRRYVKDLVGAFAATARLPKMLKRTSITDTLVNGCLAGHFVLQVTRPDQSCMTWWRARPDDAALSDSTLEVVLNEAATLVQLDSGLLERDKLPELWTGEALGVAALRAYFAGGHAIPVAGEDPIIIPAAGAAVVDAAVARAVEQGRLCYRKDAICLQAEPIPTGLLADDGELMMPWALPSPAELLPQNLPQAWSGELTTAHDLHTALGAKYGGVVPWAPVRQAIDDAERIGILAVADGLWPVDLGMAASVKFRAAQTAQQAMQTAAYAARKVAAGSAVLKAGEIQDLADQMPSLMQASDGLGLEFSVEIRIAEGGEASEETLAKLSVELAKVKDGWRIG